MSIKRQVAVGLKWQAINIVGRQLLSLAVFTTLARLLDPAAFGLLGLVGVYLAFVSLFVDQGIGSALVQRDNLEPDHLHAAFWITCGFAAILCAATLVSASPIAAFFHEPALAPLLRWSSLGLILFASSVVQSSLLQKDMDFRRIAVRSLVANLFGGAIGVGMALAGYGVWALVGQLLGNAFAGAVFLWVASSYRPAMQFSWRHFRELFHVSSSVFGSAVLWLFSSRLDQLVIGRFLGVPTLGLYVVANKIPELARFITNQPLQEVCLPALSRLQGDHSRMRQVIYTGMELNALVSFAVFGGLAAIASDLVPLLFGSMWQPAAPVCSLLLLYSLANALHVFMYPSLLASGGAGRFVIVNAWQTVGVVAACGFGVLWGVEALVLGLIINSLIIMIPALSFLKGRIGLSPLGYCRPCLVPGTAALLMALALSAFQVLLPLDVPLVFRVMLKVGVGAIIYLTIIFLAAPGVIHRMADTVRHAFLRAELSPSPAGPL